MLLAEVDLNLSKSKRVAVVCVLPTNSRCGKAELAPAHSAGLGFQQLELTGAVLVKSEGTALSQPGVGLKRGSWEVGCAMLLGQRPSAKLVLVPTVDGAVGTHLLLENGTPDPESRTACHYML